MMKSEKLQIATFVTVHFSIWFQRFELFICSGVISCHMTTNGNCDDKHDSVEYIYNPKWHDKSYVKCIVGTAAVHEKEQ